MKNLIFIFSTAFAALYCSNATAQWSELGGINAGMSSMSIFSDASGNVYAGGYFQNSGGNRYVAKFNGTSWSELGGLNALAANAAILGICMDAKGNIYAAGDFFKWVNSSRIRYVSKFNGTSWSELGSLGANSYINTIFSDASGNIYAAGDFTNNSGNRYVAKFNGSTWSELGGTNALAAKGSINRIFIDASGNIYAAGDFTNSSGNRYVAKFNGSTWSELGGTNALAAKGSINSFCSDAAGNIYVGGGFKNSSGISYVAKYNGTSWSELGGINSMQVSGTIYTICSDAKGNIYAGGGFQNSSYYYVAKFNGSSWSELGGTNALAANNVIMSICSDKSGNIYASGDFYKNNGLRYVVRYKGDWGVNYGPSGTIGVCLGKSVILNSSKSGSAYKFQWYKDKVSISGATSSSYTVFWNKPGSYFLRVDSSGHTGSSPIKSITVVPIPKVGFTVNKLIQCVNGNNFSFNDISTISSGTISRIWNFGTGTNDSSSLISPTKNYSNANSYTVKLISISDFNCMDSVVKTIMVNPMPKVGFTVNKPIQCVNGNNFSFNDTSNISSGKLSRIWNFGTGTNDTSSLFSPAKNYSTANNYSVKLVSISDFNCKDSVIKSITVNSVPTVGFTVNNIVQCLNGNDFLYTDTSKINSGSLSRKWDLGSGPNDTSSLISPAKNYSTANSYSVKLVSISDFDCLDSITKTITVNPSPVIGIISGKSNSLITNNPYTYSVNQQANMTYQWLITNGSIDSGQLTNRIVAKWLSNGSGNLTSIITNTNNCSDTSTLIVNIWSTGVRQLTNNRFEIFPNPIKSVLNIKTESKLIGSPYFIYNQIGQMIAKGEVLSKETQVNLSGLAKGLYFVNIGGNMGQSFRLLKE